MKTLEDVMFCPYCKSDNVYSYSTDEIEFSADGTGHYSADFHCSECDGDFRLYADFKYEITESRIS